MYEIDVLLKKVKRIHFIGIGGSGMCPLAEILHDWGYQLSGSDNNPGDNIDKLRSFGIPIAMGQRKENIGDAEMVVYTAALLNDNPELCAAREMGVPTFERSKLFGAITRMYSNCVGVCGTHGKTTVTSMLTQILIMADKDPTAVIGGKLPLIDSHGRVGHSDTIVCEACEFVDTFLDLSPDVSVVLNIDEDHLDYFKTLDNIIKSFHKFVSMSTKAVIYNGDDANTLKAVSGVDGKEMISFGRGAQNDFTAENIKYNRGAFAEFDIIRRGEKLGRVKLNIPGEHNILNTLAAVAAAMYCGASAEECIRGAEAFSGAGRRFEILGEFGGITIADDYAHHPRELEVTLNAVMKMGYNKVWAVFQPFTYSRTRILFDDFVRVLQIPDRCVMTEIMGSRERNTYGIYTKDLAEKIPGSVWFNTFEEVSDYVVSHAEKGDIIITLGCGDIYKAARMMAEALKNK
ncbi:MAG: UDP-N-acetylmuramate--L-alanine ligase [Oscillospiraceae bacterium]|nr:UDP-N-acetylmuramate--L-alanine ligase [Oscillospiraceae bacterium]